MKLNRTIIASAVVLLGGFSFVRAEMQTAPGASATSSVDTAKKPRNRLERLTQKLHLTDQQQLQVSAIIKDQQAAEAALKADTAATADVKKAKHKEIVADHDAKIRALLTPEQQSVFDESNSHQFGKKKA